MRASCRDHKALASEWRHSRRALCCCPLDVQHPALQRQGKSDVRHLIEAQPRHRMRQRNDGRHRPFGRRCRDAQHIHGERGICVDDVGELVRAGRILGAGTHDADRHFRQQRHGKFIARQAALQQAMDDFAIIQVRRRVAGRCRQRFLHGSINGRRRHDLSSGLPSVP